MAPARTAVAKRNWLRLLADLTRVRITVAVTFTTATGYLMAAGRADSGLLFVLLGVFLLASGSSALNQCQERGIDARMERTRRRPLPAGRIDLPTALFLAGLMILLGLSLLATNPATAPRLLFLGFLALFWYNGVYTYLKRLTPFAVVPGALIGAIPPVMGFVAGDGDPRDPRIVLTASFFFVWQIPHFWLLLLMCGDQYEKAGLPSLTGLFSNAQLRRITFVWITATAAAGLLIPALAPETVGHLGGLLIVAASLWLVLRAGTLMSGETDEPIPRRYRLAFMRINVHALVVMVCLSAGGLQAPGT